MVCLVVVNEDDEQQQHLSLFVVWLPHHTCWVSERRLGQSFPLLTWAGHDLITVILTCHRLGVHAGGLVMWRSSIVHVVVVGGQ